MHNEIALACEIAGQTEVLRGCESPKPVFLAESTREAIQHLLGRLRQQRTAGLLNPKLPLSVRDEQAGLMKTLDDPEIATLITTSGSTGTPKIAAHSFANHITSAEGVVQHLAMHVESRWLLTTPLWHVSGLGPVFRCLVSGATLVLDSSKNVAESLKRNRITHVSMVATQLQRLLQQAEQPPTTLQAILVGGGPIPRELVSEAHARGFPVSMSYGMTEMSSTICATPVGAMGSSMGLPLPGRALRIARDGEIMVRGDVLFHGYLPLGDMDRSQWFPTGDLGRIAHDGLHVEGRKDRMFISGGENIQPEEIERELCALPGVTVARVDPIKDEEFGVRPVAYVEAESVDSEEILARLSERLPRYKLPVAIYTRSACADVNS